MLKLACILSLAAAGSFSRPAVGQTAIPDLRGNWKGESETVVLGGAHPHHPATQPAEPRFTSTPFTLVIEQQNGRRFSGTFSSPGSSEPLIAVIARNGTIFAVDEDGFASGSILAPNRIELCYQQLSAAVRVASCLELTKQ
jgi:hypothetical protein